MIPKRQEILYSDLNLTFDAHPVTKTLSVLTNEEAIKRAVKNLVLTNKGERFYRSNIGPDVTRSLFENFSPITKAVLTNNIQNTLDNYELRAEVVDIRVQDQVDRHGLDITISIRPINLLKPIEVNIFLERIR